MQSFPSAIHGRVAVPEISIPTRSACLEREKGPTWYPAKSIYHNVARPLQRGVYIFDKHNGNMLSVRRKPGNKKGGYMWTP